MVAGKRRHIHGTQLGICASQRAILVPKLAGMGKSSTFSTSALHLGIFQTALVPSAGLLPYLLLLQHQLPLTTHSWGRWGRGWGHSSGAHSTSTLRALASLCHTGILSSSLHFLLQPPVIVRTSLY